MPTITVPKTRIATGAGFLYKAPLGTLYPGQTKYTVTNKAIASNVATITCGTHSMEIDDKVIVDIDDTTFDGLQTITAVAATTFSYAVTHADVTSGAATGTAVTWDAGGTVSGSVFTDAWPTGWVPWGVTREGSEFSWTPQTGNIEVAEYLLPLRIVTTGVEGKLSFEVVEITAKNIAASMNGGAVRTVSGTGATLLTELAPPNVGSETRIMLGWEAESIDHRIVWDQCFQTGDMTRAMKKGTDNMGISMEWAIEQPSIGVPFREFFSGATAVGS